ncbi:hypothetical protein EV424DRAFT_1474690 [Suillus variegatus]|nr:hypothetical protein EV424DRAFT_1474690 [Suillus variegatus]
MHAAWSAQMRVLADAYLHWKHGPRDDTGAESHQPVHYFHVGKIDVFVCKIAQNHDEAANIALLRVGLLSCSPTTPTVAITLPCLELYHQLRRRQSSFSVQAFTKVLCALHNVCHTICKVYQLTVSFRSHISKYFVNNLQSLLMSTLLSFQPDEVALFPASLRAMDGNNSAKRMDDVGYTDRQIYPSRYMITSKDVDKFKDDVRLRPGEWSVGDESVQPNESLTCTDNWQAANSMSGSENTVHVFEQTGIFLSACRHGIIQTLTEMRHSGELAKYPLATINKLIDVFGDHLGIGSDIRCSLQKTVAASSIQQKAGDHHLILAVNAFHGHAHNRKCQLQHHPLYLCGFGLEDLETCEHVFAASNAAVPLIHHVSHFHYVQFLELHFNQWDIDKYLELSRFILNNYKQALTMISDYTKELEAYHATFPGQGLDFESWIAEELTYLEAVAVEPVQDATAVEAAFEASRNNQFVSYTPSSFRPDSGLSQDALHATKQGHAVRHATERHLQVQITLDKYNKLAVSQNPQQPTLRYSEVMSYAALSEFKILKCSRYDILAKPWSNGTHCKMANKYFKIICAQEEITRLNVEIRRLQAWVDTEDSDIEWMATELDSTDTLLAAELQLLFNRQCWINDVHRNHLACIYSLPGYTGSIPLQLFVYEAQLSRATCACNFPCFTIYMRARFPMLERPIAPAIQKHPSTVHQAL